MKTKNLFLILGIIFLFVSLTGAKDFNIFNSSLTSQSYFLVNGTTGLVYANGQLVGSGTLNSTGWNSTGAKVFLANTSAYVGIGTTSPTSILHLKGTNPTLNIEASGTTDNPGIVLARTSIAGNIGSKIWLDNTNGNLYIDNWYDATNGNIYLRTRTYGTPVNAMTILGSGNVGIGTTTPGNNLSVQQLAGTGGPSLAAVNWKSPSYNLGYLGAENGSYNSGAIYIYKDGASNTVLSGNGNSYLMGGKVGIGKTAPSYTLDVVGDVNAYRLLINGTAVGTGSITGTGTAWYIPMWNGTTSLNNSAIFQNGSNIGIGTTGTNEKLTVNGDLVVLGQDIYMVQDGAANSNNEYISFNDSAILNSGGAFSFFADAARGGSWTLPTAAISAKDAYFAGNVGIGTTLPATTLDVNGNTYLRSTTYLGENQTLGSYGGNNGRLRFSNLDGLSIYNSGGEIVRFSTGGNVGIGTTAPSEILDIEKTTSANIRMYDKATAAWFLKATTHFDILRGSTNMLHLDNTGNIGIGTTSPGSKLEIIGNETHISGDLVGTDAILRLYNEWSSDTAEKGATIVFEDKYLGATRTTRAAIKGGTQTAGNTANGFLSFYTDSGSANSMQERMRIDSSGNVGIGTVLPTVKLDVAGVINATNLLINGSSVLTSYTETDPKWTANLTSGLSQNLNMNGKNIIGIQNVTSTSDAVFPHLVLDSTGSGDDWLSQGAYISLGESGDLGAAALHMTYVGNGLSYIGSGAVTSGIPGASYLRFDYDSDEIYSPDNLQVGTLDTGNGNMYLGNAAVANGDTDSIPTGDQVYDFVGSNPFAFYNSTNLPSRISGSGTAWYIPMWNGTTSLNNSGIYQSAGNVGIGTTSSQGKLHLYQVAGSSNLVLESDDTTPIAGDDLGQIDWYNPNSGGNVRARILGEADGTWSGGYYATRISFWTNNVGTTLSEKMRIDNSGNVGIGTTSPEFKLDVVGNVNAYNLLINGTAVSTTTGTLTGTGTAWYIPMWNGTTSLNNSAVTQNGSNVGIGTTAPGFKLDVSGTTRVSGTTLRVQTGTSSLTGQMDFGNADTLAGYDSSIFKIRTWDSVDYYEAMRVDGTNHRTILAATEGNVGIGTTAPTVKLDVAGVINATNLLINGTAVSTTTGTLTGTGTAWYIPMWNGTTSLNNSAVTQNGSNVGIGTTSLNSKFTIYGTAGDWGSNLQMFDNTGVYNSRISVASDGLLFRNFYANSTNDAIAYSFRNSNDGKLVTIKGGGNVGIGTTAPTQKLDVIGNVNVTGDVYPSTAYTRNLGLSGNRWGAFYTYNADISNLLTVGGNTNIGNGDFFVNVTSERVGIGTTAPGQIVSINGVSNSITPVIEYQVDGSTKGYIGAAASTGGIINGAVSGDLVLRSQGQKIMFSTDSGTTAQMMINGSGYVGIGTTSSFLGKLTVIQSGGNEGIYVNSSGTGAVGVYGIGGASVSSTGITGTSGGVGVRGFGGEIGINGDGSSYGVEAYGGQYGVYAEGVSSFDVYAPNNGVGPFTGGHEAKLSNGLSTKFKPGMIVSVTGESQKKIENGTVAISSTLPTVKLSEIANDKKILGVFVKTISLSKDHWYVNLSKPEDKFGIINALGDGRVLVTDINGNIEAGDYITTSNIAGYGMKQNDDLVHSYTLGKATEDVEWETVKDTVTYNGKKYKVYLIGVVYTSG